MSRPNHLTIGYARDAGDAGLQGWMTPCSPNADPVQYTFTLYKVEMQEERMRTRVKVVSWVVYRMTVHGGPPRLDAVPRRGQWDEMLTRADIKEDAGGLQGTNGVCERSE